ncbi:class I SAM-dependent methyltransferase [Arenicella xantha]|uniref:Methyltransferase family protein n=1 Tax=Arenicella xantha TaxID=644221 RepID=A0A395JLA5_9GAMM|nr:class I SAM-dependent methyltransferase [Arenicella xantha]RBP51491.1 methyltransferase family protein [Arenicella xantha]
MDEQVYKDMSVVEGEHWWFVARRQYLKRIIAKFVFRERVDLELCEIGSGTGGNLPLLAEFGNVTAIEMEPYARQFIEQRGLDNVVKVAGGSLPDDIDLTAQYDGVFLLDVVEHIQDDLAALKAVQKFIRKDGVLVTTVPAYQWLWSAHDVANHHCRRYTLPDYRRLLENAGYQVQYASYFNSVLFPLAVVERVSSRLKGAIDNVDTGLSIPVGVINSTLKALFGLERLWAGILNIPFGLSMVVVATKKD